MKIKAFTLAEVLITLAIIGVVAALTIPSLLSGYEEKQYNTARLKALHTFGEAGKMASINNVMTGQPTAKDFVNNVLSKYLKITKVCDSAEDCDFPDTFKPFSSSQKIKASDIEKWNQLGRYNYTSIGVAVDDASLSTYIKTVDGFSAKLFYNPDCIRESEKSSINNMDIACINVVYDMNGKKEPNHVGEDIGIVTTFWSGLKVTSVAPGPVYSIDPGTYKTNSEAAVYCSSFGTRKISYTLPNIDELSSLHMNHNLTSIYLGRGNLWSGSLVKDAQGQAWYIPDIRSVRSQKEVQAANIPLCVRR